MTAIKGTKISGVSFAMLDSDYVNGIADGVNMGYLTVAAHAGGGQALATQIAQSGMLVNIGTVASVGDSVGLPFAIPGILKFVFNSTANSCNIFGQVAVNKATNPAVIDTINGTAGSTAYALAGGARVCFFCPVAGLWAALTG
jgi:hypothetical protein